MGQDRKLLKIKNLNMETNTNLDDKECENMLPEDSNKTDNSKWI